MDNDEQLDGRLGRLHQEICEAFSLDELDTLCLYLDVPFDNLSGDTTTAKARELLQYMARRERMATLIDGLRHQRPQYDWQSIYPTERDDGRPPFRGLQSYREEDSDLFFGRSAQIEKLLSHLQNNRFLALVGASGSGKSSLVRAGVIPAVRKGAIKIGEHDSADWPIHIIEPGSEPLKALAASLTRDETAVSATASLLNDLSDDAQSLDLFLYRELAEKRDGRYFLVVDQFEELFTQCSDPEVRLRFVENLVKAVHEGGAGSADGRLSLVIVLRADFYTQAIQLERLQPLFESNQLIVPAMNGDELRQAIEGPLKAGGWEMQPGLLETIMQDLGAAFGRTPEPGALPLLSLALHETWLRRSDRTLTLAGYQDIGGVQGAITNSAGQVYNNLNEAEQRLARNIFLELVELNEDIPDTRRRVPLDVLAPDEESRRVVNLFADKRLLNIGRNGVEVAHEAIIREWPILQGWLAENRQWLQVRREIGDAAERWQEHGRDPALLYRGSILARAQAQAEQWRSHTGQALSKLEDSFIAAGQDAEAARIQQQQSDRQIRAMLFGGGGGGLAFALAYFITFSGQSELEGLIAYLSILRVLPGILAGVIFALLYRPSLKNGRLPGLLYHGLVGAAALAMALLFHSFLRQQNLTLLLLAGLEGGGWGFAVGAGIYWIFSTERPYWQTIPAVTLLSALVLLLGETAAHAYDDPGVLRILLAGALMPLALITAVYLSHQNTKPI